MMSLSVVLIVVTYAALLVLRWGRAVLVDEDRYLRAVAHLPQSRRLARLAGWSVSVAAQHHAGWRQGLTPRAARLLALTTRRSMSTRSVGRAWTVGHRWLHRGRGPDRRLAVAMLAMAATGELIGALHRARNTSRRTRRTATLAQRVGSLR